MCCKKKTISVITATCDIHNKTTDNKYYYNMVIRQYKKGLRTSEIDTYHQKVDASGLFIQVTFQILLIANMTLFSEFSKFINLDNIFYLLEVRNQYVILQKKNIGEYNKN